MSDEDSQIARRANRFAGWIRLWAVFAGVSLIVFAFLVFADYLSKPASLCLETKHFEHIVFTVPPGVSTIRPEGESGAVPTSSFAGLDTSASISILKQAVGEAYGIVNETALMQIVDTRRIEIDRRKVDQNAISFCRAGFIQLRAELSVDEPYVSLIRQNKNHETLESAGIALGAWFALNAIIVGLFKLFVWVADGFKQQVSRESRKSDMHFVAQSEHAEFKQPESEATETIKSPSPPVIQEATSKWGIVFELLIHFVAISLASAIAGVAGPIGVFGALALVVGAALGSSFLVRLTKKVFKKGGYRSLAMCMLPIAYLLVYLVVYGAIRS